MFLAKQNDKESLAEFSGTRKLILPGVKCVWLALSWKMCFHYRGRCNPAEEICVNLFSGFCTNEEKGYQLEFGKMNAPVVMKVKRQHILPELKLITFLLICVNLI